MIGSLLGGRTGPESGPECVQETADIQIG